MSVRLLLTDEAWAELAPILARLKSRAGRPPALSDRMFIEAVLSLARTGTPWRDLPEAFGPWDAVYNRFRRGEARGLWRRLWECLQAEDGPMTHHRFIEATMVRAHQQAAQALGRSRGGLSTKMHAGCRDERTGIALILTAGPCHERPVFAPVLAQGPPELL
jgi:transposase